MWKCKISTVLWRQKNRGYTWGLTFLYNGQTQECLEAQTRVKVVTSFSAALSAKSYSHFIMEGLAQKWKN